MPAPVEEGHAGGYQLQASSFRSDPEAQAFANALRQRGHPHRHHGAVQVPLADLHDVLTYLEYDGRPVEVLDRGGQPVLVSGLWAGADR